MKTTTRNQVPTETPPPMIRPACAEDLGAINAIYNHYVRHSTCTYQEQPEPIEGRREWFAHHGSAHPVTVAVMNGRIVGWGALSAYHARSAYRHTVENSVYVAPAFHRQGIGSALLRDLIERARVLGHHAIIAGIDAGQPASIGLHAKFGFERVGHLREVGLKFDRWLDVIYMGLRLGPPARSARFIRSRRPVDADLELAPAKTSADPVKRHVPGYKLKVAVRRMTPGDYDAVFALWRATPGIGLDSDSDSREGIARYLKRNRGLSFVALVQGAVVGAVLSGHDGRRGYLHHLAVSPAHRRRGIGKALTLRCLQALGRKGIPKCNIFLFRSNAKGKAFWTHSGWNLRRDLSVMQKRS